MKTKENHLKAVRAGLLGIIVAMLSTSAAWAAVITPDGILNY